MTDNKKEEIERKLKEREDELIKLKKKQEEQKTTQGK
jgi:hypothetical protein